MNALPRKSPKMLSNLNMDHIWRTAVSSDISNVGAEWH